MGIILRKETKEKFGYSVDDLKPSSEKFVVWECRTCGIVKEKKFRAAKKTSLCLICSNKKNAHVESSEEKSKRVKERYKTHEHPLKGKHRPEHVKEALRVSHMGKPLSEETKRKISKKNSGKNNPFYGKHHTSETKAYLDKLRKKNVRRGKDSNFYGHTYHSKGQWCTRLSGKKIWMRSSWEVKYAEYLDKNTVEWDYESRAFPIVLNEKEQTYRPDFFLVKENQYVEIKGYWRDDAKEKFDAFCEQYPKIKIVVLMKDDLIAMGIKVK